MLAEKRHLRNILEAVKTRDKNRMASIKDTHPIYITILERYQRHYFYDGVPIIGEVKRKNNCTIFTMRSQVDARVVQQQIECDLDNYFGKWSLVCSEPPNKYSMRALRMAICAFILSLIGTILIVTLGTGLLRLGM